jgi:hypothetical protein
MSPVWFTVKICECLSALCPCVFKVRCWCNSTEFSTVKCIQSWLICVAIPCIVIAGYHCFGRFFCLHFQNKPEDHYHKGDILMTSTSYFKLYKSLLCKILKSQFHFCRLAQLERYAPCTECQFSIPNFV